MARRKQRETYGNGSVSPVMIIKKDAKGNPFLDKNGNPIYDAPGVSVEDALEDMYSTEGLDEADVDEYEGRSLLELTKKELSDYAAKLEKEMRDAAKDLLFERAAVLRDRLLEVRSKL